MATKNLGCLGAAERALAESGEPLHYGEITRRALSGGWLETSGKTPDATMDAQIATQLKRQGADSTFVRLRPGVFGLRRWLAEGKIDPTAIKKGGVWRHVNSPVASRQRTPVDSASSPSATPSR